MAEAERSKGDLHVFVRQAPVAYQSLEGIECTVTFVVAITDVLAKVCAVMALPAFPSLPFTRRERLYLDAHPKPEPPAFRVLVKGVGRLSRAEFDDELLRWREFGDFSFDAWLSWVLTSQNPAALKATFRDRLASHLAERAGLVLADAMGIGFSDEDEILGVYTLWLGLGGRIPKGHRESPRGALEMLGSQGYEEAERILISLSTLDLES